MLNSIKYFLFIFLLLLLTVNNLYSQKPFLSKAVTESFIPITGGIELTTVSNGDDVYQLLDIGSLYSFSFKFNNSTYNKLYVSSNGFISLNTGYTNASNFLNRSSNIDLIAPWWDDLDPSRANGATEGTSKYKVSGNAPNRKITIEWDRFHQYRSYGANDQMVTFQVTIYENSDKLMFNYKENTFTNNRMSASIGFHFINNTYLAFNHGTNPSTLNTNNTLVNNTDQANFSNYENGLALYFGSFLDLILPTATLTSCLASSSLPTSFGVAGWGLTASVTISAPSDFEISTTSDGTYTASLTLANTSTVSQTLYVRLSNSATVGSKTGTITATSTGASDVTTTISGTVNASPNITISGNTTDVDLVTLTASGGNIYAWSDGSSRSTASNTFDASGLYSLSVTNSDGCISSTQYNITVQHSGLNKLGGITLDSTSQINKYGKIGSLNPISKVGKKNDYKTNIPSVQIGSQIWTNKNLDVTTYQNGDVIPQVTDPTVWAGLTTGAWTYYNNDPANGAIYGKLYNWYAVNDTRGLAPAGWHVPSDAEWTALGTYLGGNSVAGGKMKTTGTTYWASPNTNATNESGFAGLPGGYCGWNGYFNDVGSLSYWWIATQVGSRGLDVSSGVLGSYTNAEVNGFSVRLIKD